MLVFIGVGSNLGDKVGNCRRAIEALLADARNRIVQCSPLYQTEPVGKKEQDWFINGAFAMETSMEPAELLEFLLGVEKMMGRERRERWGPRVIDLDILIFGQQVINKEALEIPHPRLHERRFVLVPLRDIAPDLRHPLLGKTISQILEELPGGEKVFPLPQESQKRCPV
jgi:2-amino-4-hydroxy-6-hydroxymethyldihydropteridine diphosphokinase